MKVRIYSIFDKQLSVYGTLMSSSNDVTIRRVMESIARNFRDVSAHPDLYSLHCVGEFDDATGVVSPINPVVICEMSIFYGDEQDNNNNNQ